MGLATAGGGMHYAAWTAIWTVCVAVYPPGARILALSHDGETPAKVAKMLATSGWGESGITALTDMGGESENQITDTAVNWAEQDVGALNTLAITCIASFDAKPLPRTTWIARRCVSA